MVFVYAPGQPQNGAPGVGIPVGSPQSRKGRNHIAAVGVVDLLGHVLGIHGGFDKPKLIPKPLDGGPGHKNGAFEGIVHLPIQPPSDGGHQPVPGENGGFSGVHQQKGTGSVGTLGIAGIKAGLSEEGCLLVTGSTGNGDGCAEKLGGSVPINPTGGNGLWEHGRRDIQQLQNLLIPLQSVDVEQHGSGGVGIIGYMNLSAAELPDQPGFHGAEQKLPIVCQLPCSGDVFQNPADFGAGKIGIDYQTGFLPDGIHQPLFRQAVAVFGGSAALPHNGVTDGTACGFVPDDGGFTLVGDADGGDIRSGGTDVGHGLPGYLQLGGEDLVGVMLHPAGLGENLGKFLLGDAAYFPCVVEQDAAVGGGAGIQRHNILGHRAHPFCVLLDVGVVVDVILTVAVIAVAPGAVAEFQLGIGHIGAAADGAAV